MIIRAHGESMIKIGDFARLSQVSVLTLEKTHKKDAAMLFAASFLYILQSKN